MDERQGAARHTGALFHDALEQGNYEAAVYQS